MRSNFSPESIVSSGITQSISMRVESHIEVPEARGEQDVTNVIKGLFNLVSKSHGLPSSR